METRDLTPAEARAEVEAFLGGGFVCGAHASKPGYYAYAHSPDFSVRVDGLGPTYRAAVAALKQAWRDAVRPWCERAIDAKLDTADVDGYAPTERVLDRMMERGLGEEA